MTNDEAYKLAELAVTKLVKDRGADAVFPLDAIWAYVDEDVPSTMRPHQWNPLVKNGFLQVQEGRVKAESIQRAGSVTRAYPIHFHAPEYVVFRERNRQIR